MSKDYELMTPISKPVDLPCYGIKLTPAIISDRIERGLCPHCNEPDCCYSCELSTAQMLNSKTEPPIQTEDEVAARLKANGAIDGITSLILACHCAGINVKTPAFLEAIETAIAAVGNNA